MPDPVRWLLAATAVLLVIALIAWARGPKHHHGDDIGALGAHVTVRSAA
jgi:hypothetical protein